MTGKLAYERYFWFHGQIKASLYPNAKKLAEEFEISPKQAQRDIDFIRDRLGAPLKFNRERNGYEYEKSGYELPPIWFSEDELLAFCISLRLAAAIPDRDLKRSLQNFLARFLSTRSLSPPPSLPDIEERISIKNIEYYRVDEGVFRTVVSALFKDQPLRITYHTPHKGERTERLILPRHLFCYMGSWHLVAYCTLRGELRDFALSRIIAAAPTKESIELPAELPSAKEYVRRGFGVIAGKDAVEVVLKFSPAVSSWVAEQIWHESQQVTWGKDGSLTLRFPVSGYAELVREILRYGPEVEVLSPADLRGVIKKEIKKMQEVYR